MQESLTFQEIISKTTELIKKFERIEKRKWGIEAQLAELSKQTGELSKNIMTFEGYYPKERDNDPRYATSKEKIADELWDILFMIIRISNHYGIDLEQEHIKQINKLKERFG